MHRLMTSLAAAAGLTLGLGEVALAADMPTRAPVYKAAPMVAAYNWTGWYIGANAGGGWGKSDPSLTILPTTVPAQTFFNPANIPGVQNTFNGLGLKPDGFTAGGQIGYNWQLAPSWVFGLEADFGYFHLTDSNAATAFYLANPANTFTQTSSVSTDWLFTARPRLGWAANNWLFFVTGGVAVTNVKTAYTFTDTFFNGFVNAGSSSTKAGWTVGGGVEWAPWSNNWTMKVEYLYADFGTVSDAAVMTGTVGLAPPTFNYSTSLKANIVRAGLNFRF
jgi:outer membrane immunogenic protein